MRPSPPQHPTEEDLSRQRAWEAADGDGPTFEDAAAEVETAVLHSCARQREWPARIAAGIRAAVEFAAEHPDAARALTIDSRAGEPEGDAYFEMVARFAAMLRAGAPRPEALPASSDRAVVNAIASIISHHVRSGQCERLGHGDPDLVFLALLPYLGFAEAIRWSREPLAV